MLESLSSVIVNLLEKQKHDQEILQQKISELGDEVAKKISWIPLTSGASSISTHSLKEDKEGNYYISGTWKLFFFALPVFLIGIITLPFFVGIQNSDSSQNGMGILFSLMFTGTGVFMLVGWYRKKIFDFSTQSFYTYFFRKKIDGFNGGTPLGDIHALQILSTMQSTDRNYRMGTGGGKYYNYQVNIVLKNAERKRVCMFSDINTCQEAAKKIAQRLNVPIWDMSAIATYPVMMVTGNPGN